MLHHVRNEPEQDFAPNSGLTVSPEFLDVTILRLKQEGYQFVSLDELAKRLETGDFDPTAKPMIAITLDDGYRDNLQNAVPIFRRHEVPYTIYIAPGLISGSHTLWWEDLEILISTRKRINVDGPNGRKSFETISPEEKRTAFAELMHYLTTQVDEVQQREIVDKLSNVYNHDAKAHAAAQIMNWRELKSLANDPLSTFGAHTMGHFAVARLSADEARQEIKQSRDELEQQIGTTIRHFAYPYGYPAAAGLRDFELTREIGFKTAVTTRHGVLYQEHGKHLTGLPRISLNGSYQSMRYVRTLLSGVTTRMNNRGKRLNVA